MHKTKHSEQKLCGEIEEKISHVVAKCRMLAQKKYRLWRQNRIGVIFHWTICKRYRFSNAANYYEHTHTDIPEKVLAIDNVKILLDVSAETTGKLAENKSDNLIIDKKKGECHTNAACPFDTRVKEKEQEKAKRYQKLKRERDGESLAMQKVVVILIIIEALGTIGKGFRT